MSAAGSGDRRRAGWEEAGAEFYQESYPVDKDAKDGGKDRDKDARDGASSSYEAVATLLPSKQMRGTQMRNHQQQQQHHHHTKTRTRTRRRQSNAKDTLVSMLPDLSENISTEESTWEEMQRIKALPVPMAEKRERKERLRQATKLRLQGLGRLRWRRRKALASLGERFGRALAKVEPWRSSLKRIEGERGTGVVAFFLFVRWLLFLNLAAAAMIGGVVVAPALLAAPRLDSEYLNETYAGGSAVLNAVQGTGAAEKTLLFYGFYPNTAWGAYDLPLAYVSAIVGYYAMCLLAIVRRGARGAKERLVEGEGQSYGYCDLAFGGWDFCVRSESSARVKRAALRNEIRARLDAERRDEERRSRSKMELLELFIARTFVNSVVVVILFASAFAIYVAFDFSADELQSEEFAEDSHDALEDARRFLLQYLTSICIVVLNAIVPAAFRFLVAYEKYRPAFVVKITILRTVFLRLSSLAVLTIRLGSSIRNDSDRPRCWETYVGQQFYKLLLADFAVQLTVTFLVNFPRSLLARGSSNSSSKLRSFGEQQFDLPKHVLDVVYAQTLCWLGAFYCPALPAIAALFFFATFYVKKFACLVNCRPPAAVYRASKSNSLFAFVLLMSFGVAVAPVGYSLVEFTPSEECGPFRSLPTVWAKVAAAFERLPDGLRAAAVFFGTSAFAIPACVGLALALYYYWAVADANRHMVAVLKSQLVLEGHDKQFLLNRLSAFIRQQCKRNERRHNHAREDAPQDDDSIRMGSK